MATYHSFLLLTKNLHGNCKIHTQSVKGLNYILLIFFFHRQTMSFVTMVTRDLTFVTRGS
jgi:hypothetical protein